LRSGILPALATYAGSWGMGSPPGDMQQEEGPPARPLG